MRRFSSRQLTTHSDSSLEAWIRNRCEYLSRMHDLIFELDFSTGAEPAGCSPSLLTLLDKILGQAVKSSEPDSTVEIGTYWTRRGLEIEVATSSDLVDDQSVNAFRKESVVVGNGFSLSLYRARCPQGGTAWIIVQSHFARLRMVA